MGELKRLINIYIMREYATRSVSKKMQKHVTKKTLRNEKKNIKK
jgi:hypothetical protein